MRKNLSALEGLESRILMHGDSDLQVQVAESTAMAAMDGAMSHDDTAHDDMSHGGHFAALALAPHADATNVAVKSGDWSDPSIWSSSAVPSDGANVFIPEGLSVTYDVVSTDSLFWLRVDGELHFATDRDTLLKLDTFIVAPTGALTIGAQDSPVQDGVTASIVFADNGAIDQHWDPTQISRGLISHGSVEIVGQEKTGHVKVAETPLAGDQTLTLSETPTNWRVGDRLVLTGTHYVDDDHTQDEELVIAAIDGKVITLDRPLTYDHDAPAEDLAAYVANYSRNVRFETENFENLPSNQRGHTMFMDSEDIYISYAEFYELGRTDKSTPLDDYELNGHDRVLDQAGNPIPGPSTNIRARYSLHLHRLGVGVGESPAIIIGNAIWGSPGWGLVQHDSAANLTDNAVYNVFGSGIVSETGNETGTWDNNIVIKTLGVSLRSGLSDFEKGGAGNQDFGRSGVSYWMQSRNLTIRNNVAAGAGGGGFFFMTRGVDQIKTALEDLDFNYYVNGLPYISPDHIPIRDFDHNEVIASKAGFQVVKSNQNQGHDLRTHISDFTAWEVIRGVEVQYTGKYTFTDLRIIGTTNQADWSRAQEAIRYGNNVVDMVINGAQISNFEHAIYAKKTANHSAPTDGNWGFVFVDFVTSDISKEFFPGQDSFDVFLDSEDLLDSEITLQPGGPNLDLVFDMGDASDRRITLDGYVTDSLGVREILPLERDMTLDYKRLKGVMITGGYEWQEDGTVVAHWKVPISDRATGEYQVFDIPVKYVNFKSLPPLPDPVDPTPIDDTTAPTVVGVTLGSSKSQGLWSYSDVDQFQTAGLGAIDEVIFEFSETVSVSQEDLTLSALWGAVVPEIESFELQGTTATWRLAQPITSDQYLVGLSGDITDDANLHLDGEWINPTSLGESTGFTSSGDGETGGRFEFLVTVLYGDIDGDNLITGSDFATITGNIDLVGANYADGDLDADGSVTFKDLLLFTRNRDLDLRMLPGAPPQVTDVLLGSTQSGASFSLRDAEESTGKSPFAGVDTVTVVFSEEVRVTADHLVLVSKTGKFIPEVIGFHVDGAEVTWELSSPLISDQYSIELSEEIVDNAGMPLDGEALISDGTIAFPSGDTMPGGVFRLAFNVLNSDVNGDNIVDSTDYLAFLSAYGNTATSIRQGDLNGDGVVDFLDVSVFAGDWGLDFSAAIDEAFTALELEGRELLPQVAG